MPRLSPPVHRRGGAFVRLAAMSGRDMLRNPLTGLSMLFVFGTIMVAYTSMWLAFTVLGVQPSASLAGAAPGVVGVLERAGVTIVDVDAPERNAIIDVRAEGVTVVLEGMRPPAWDPIWTGLREAGFAAGTITVTDDEGDVKLDPLREYLGVALMLGLASVAFIGTTVPLVAMRERGLLRLLGTTPLRRSTFLLAQLPPRALVAASLIAITVAVAVRRRYSDGVDLAGLGITCVLGAAMLLAIGLLLAARSRSAEAAQQSMAMLTIMLALPSGGILPSALVPVAAQVAMNVLPSTWIASAASASLTGAEPFLPLPVLWTLMGAGAVIAALVAARTFEWDQSEPIPVRQDKTGASR